MDALGRPATVSGPATVLLCTVLRNVRPPAYARGMTHVLPPAHRRPSGVDMRKKGFRVIFGSSTTLTHRLYILISPQCNPKFHIGKNFKKSVDAILERTKIFKLCKSIYEYIWLPRRCFVYLPGK